MPNALTCYDGNPLPTGLAKGGAATIKFFIAAGAIAEIGFSIAGCVNASRKQPSASVALRVESLTLAAILYDFSLSCAFGYALYSPMDASSSKLAGTSYAAAIENTSTACSNYTYMWLVKTAISTIGAIIPIGLSQAEKNAARRISPEGEAGGSDIKFEKVRIYANRVVGTLNIVAAGISLVLEFIAIGHFATFPKDNLDKKKIGNDKLVADPKGQYQDCQVFLSDTIGFICGDLRNIVDGVIAVTGMKNLPALTTAMVIREMFAGAYVASQFASFGIIAAAPSK